MSKNIWDEKWEHGSISENGKFINNSKMIRSSLVVVNGGEKYRIIHPKEITVYFYDEDYNFYGSETLLPTDDYITIPLHADLMHFTVEGFSYDNNICINTDGDYSDGYEPYEEEVVEHINVAAYDNPNILTNNTYRL